MVNIESKLWDFQKSVVGQEAKSAEPPSPAELRHFDARFTLEVADSPVQQVLAVVKDCQGMPYHNMP